MPKEIIRGTRILAIFEPITAIGRVDTLKVHVAAALAWSLAIALDLPSLTLIASNGDVARALRALLCAAAIILTLLRRGIVGGRESLPRRAIHGGDGGRAECGTMAEWFLSPVVRPTDVRAQELRLQAAE